MIYLVDVIVRIVELGVTTVMLLESVIGSVLSVQLSRRRLICLVVLAYEALRGAPSNAILRLSGALRLELLSWAITAPLAWSDMRAAPPQTLHMV